MGFVKRKITGKTIFRMCASVRARMCLLRIEILIGKVLRKRCKFTTLPNRTCQTGMW